MWVHQWTSTVIDSYLRAGLGSGGLCFVSLCRVGVGLTSELISRPTVGACLNSSGLCSCACDVADGITESRVLGGQPQAGVCSSFLLSRSVVVSPTSHQSLEVDLG